MGTETIIQLIIAYSLNSGIDPHTALAVARVESNFKTTAIGPVGEVGVFQVRPEYSRYTAKQLKNPHLNIQEGIRILKDAKARCAHKENKTWIVCYNLGVGGGKKIKYPKLFPYYKKILKAKKEVRKYVYFIDVFSLEETTPYTLAQSHE